MTEQVLLARQPIFNASLEVQAYELLFRDNPGAASGVEDGRIDGDFASSQVLLNAFNELDLTDLLSGHPAYVNFSRTLLFETLPFSTQHLVIEVLEDIEIDQAVVERVSHLKKEGYTIALDDFVFEQNLTDLVRCADVVKVDVLALDRKQIEQQSQLLKKFKVKLLAEKVEDFEMYRYCQQLGFELFQGYFFARPHIIKGRKTSPQKLSVMKLLCELQKSDMELTDLERIIAHDPNLTFKLLKLVNSAAFTSVTEIHSLKQAITRLGTTQIRNWASLLAMSKVDDKTAVLPHTCAVRAKMCELIGEKISSKHADIFFTAGLFSGLDAMLDTPMDELLPELPLTDTINKAILNHQGVVGMVLKTVLEYEQAHWNKIPWQHLQRWKINDKVTEEFYKEAIIWGDHSF